MYIIAEISRDGTAGRNITASFDVEKASATFTVQAHRGNRYIRTKHNDFAAAVDAYNNYNGLVEG